MMLETVHEVFAGMVMPAFMTIIEFHQQNIRGEISDQPRDKQCETFHKKVREMTKGNLETKWSMWHAKYPAMIVRMILPRLTMSHD